MSPNSTPAGFARLTLRHRVVISCAHVSQIFTNKCGNLPFITNKYQRILQWPGQRQVRGHHNGLASGVYADTTMVWLAGGMRTLQWPGQREVRGHYNGLASGRYADERAGGCQVSSLSIYSQYRYTLLNYFIWLYIRFHHQSQLAR